MKQFKKNELALNIESARNYLIEEEFKNCEFDIDDFYEKFNPSTDYRICISGEALRFILERVKKIESFYKNEIKNFYEVDMIKGKK